VNSIYRYKDQILDAQQQQLSEQLQQTNDFDDQMILLSQKKKLDEIRKRINQQLGIVIIK
jgi:hypothetical protein